MNLLLYLDGNHILAKFISSNRTPHGIGTHDLTHHPTHVCVNVFCFVLVSFLLCVCVYVGGGGGGGGFVRPKGIGSKFSTVFQFSHSSDEFHELLMEGTHL
jgi:hypothetical protein